MAHLALVLGMWSLRTLSSQQGESNGGLGLKCLRKTSNKCLRESLEQLGFSVTVFAVQLFFFLTGKKDTDTTTTISFKVGFFFSFSGANGLKLNYVIKSHFLHLRGLQMPIGENFSFIYFIVVKRLKWAHFCKS